MAEHRLKINIVSAEDRVFSGEATLVTVTGEMGELGITPRHVPLLTRIVPGNIRVTCLDGTVDVFYVSGGLLEVQPSVVTVLADLVERAYDLDEAKILETEQKARSILAEQSSTDLDYFKAISDLAHATAQLQALKHTREKVQKARR